MALLTSSKKIPKTSTDAFRLFVVINIIILSFFHDICMIYHRFKYFTDQSLSCFYVLFFLLS